MRGFVMVGVAGLAVALVAGVAVAKMTSGPTSPMPGGMGSGMGPMMGAGGCPGMAGEHATQAAFTEEKGKEAAQGYADKYLKGFTVDKVLPFTGMHGTMYSVEMKGPNEEVRTFHVNPWGNVMPFGGPARRAG
jgi:hypothetical protein